MAKKIKKYRCSKCNKAYVYLKWAYKHNQKKHKGKAKFHTIGRELIYEMTGHKELILHKKRYTAEEVARIVKVVRFQDVMDICTYINNLKHAKGKEEFIMNIEKEFVYKGQRKEAKESKSLGALFG